AAGRSRRDRGHYVYSAGRASAGRRATGLDAGHEAAVKLGISIAPDFVKLIEAEVKAGERAVTTSIRGAGDGLKIAWRRQITGAGLGQRLANTIRSASYPKGRHSLNAAALVWSKAPVIVG